MDSLVQGLLNKKENIRTLTRKEEKVKKEKEDAGRDQAIKVNDALTFMRVFKSNAMLVMCIEVEFNLIIFLFDVISNFRFNYLNFIQRL